MSRTHKDKSWKLADPQSRWDYGRVRIPYESDRYEYRAYFYLDEAGVKTKKPRSYNERHWMPTPMWWIREFMTQPQRTRGKEWERRVVKCDDVDSIIDLDQPTVSRKPHLYFW
jgi:hypothetical protein